jgi:predicted permease
LQTTPIPLRVVGVAPPGFEGARRGERTDVWVPRATFNSVLAVPGEQALPPFAIWARLRPGDTLGDVDRRVKDAYHPRASVASLNAVYGTPNSHTVVIGQRSAAGIVAGLALLVLLGGCAAIATLMFVHYERRRLEFGVRASLGASRHQLMSLLASELALIGVVGTLGSILVASLVAKFMQSLSLQLPGGIELGRLDSSLDWRVLLFGLSITAATLALAAFLPMARFTSSHIAGEVVRTSSATASTASQRVRQGLLATLTSVTVVVLVVAGLFVRAVNEGFSDGAGFDTEGTIYVTAPVAPPGAPLTMRTREFSDSRASMVLETLRGLPGVERVAIGAPPIDRSYAIQSQTVRTLPGSDQEHRMRVGFLAGTADLLEALGVPLVAGRYLTASDADVRPSPIVLTESVVNRLWPQSNPLGQPLSEHYVVVGVAKDFVFGSFSEPADGVQVVARSKDFGEKPRFVMQTSRRDRAFHDEILRTLQIELPNAAKPTVVSGRDVVSTDLGRQRLAAWFFSGFGLVALLVGSGSVFGLVSYLAESRRREFGIRLALGASSSNIIRQGIGVALIPCAIGLLIGLALSLGLSHVFEAMLVGISPLDWMTYGAVSVGLLAMAGLASWAAAMRLRGVQPVEALKAQ